MLANRIKSDQSGQVGEQGKLADYKQEQFNKSSDFVEYSHHNYTLANFFLIAQGQFKFRIPVSLHTETSEAMLYYIYMCGYKGVFI